MPECPVNCRCLGLQGPALIHSPSENLQTQKMQLAISERLPEAGLCVCTHLCTQLKHHLPSSPLPHALSTCHGSPRASLLVFSWSISWDAQGLLSQGQEHYEEVWRPQDSGGMVNSSCYNRCWETVPLSISPVWLHLLLTISNPSPPVTLPLGCSLIGPGLLLPQGLSTCSALCLFCLLSDIPI